MALDAPLNQRQIDVLQWISKGCQEGRWPDHTYKTTAAALEWRGLVTVSKRGGVWTASILSAGARYLATGNYTPGHKLHRVRSMPPPTATVPVAKPTRKANARNDPRFRRFLGQIDDPPQPSSLVGFRVHRLRRTGEFYEPVGVGPVCFGSWKAASNSAGCTARHRAGTAQPLGPSSDDVGIRLDALP